MKRQIAILGLSFILMAGMLMPLAMGENDSLHVVMTVEDRNYSIGDTVTLTIRVYNLGVLADLASPADLQVGVSTHHSFNNAQNLTPASSGTGIYTASYTIKAADNNQNLYFFYDATLGNDHDATENYNDALVIHVYSIQDTVDVSICGQDMVPAHPGDVITATILTRTGATLIPVTGFTQLYVENPGGDRQNYTTYTTEQNGIYSIEFTVPQIAASGVYEILAQPMGMGDQDSAYVYVNVMDVWYHRIAKSGNTVSFEICVADLLGAPVEGADFYIARNGWPNDVYAGATNASGKYLLHIPDIEGAASFSGYVLAGGLNQSIEGVVLNYVTQEPAHNEFDILWEGTETIFEPDTDVTITYGAYDSRIPASSKNIYYYVTATGTDFTMLSGTVNHNDAPREVVAAGVATTDAQGKFSIAFKTPDEQCQIQVGLEVPLDRADFQGQDYDRDDNKYYAVWPQNAWNTEGFVFYAYEGNLDGDGEVGVSGGGFKPGKAGTVTVDLSAGTGDPIIAMWGIGEGSLETMESAEPEWMSWVPAGYLLRLEKTESGKYEGSFLVPEFIEDQDVTVISGYMDSADGVPHFDSKTISPGSAFPWLWIIIAIVIIVVVIVAIVVIRDRI